MERTLLVCGVVATLAVVSLLLWMRSATAKILRHEARDEAGRMFDLKRDALTGALARRFFVEELKHAVRPMKTGAPVAILLIDLDHFKKLNDSYGHNVGDYALTHLVETAASVFPGGTVGRLGGDEFAVLVGGVCGSMLMDRAEEFLTALRRPALASGRQIALSASIGIAVSPDHSTFPEELILLADLALYESKRNGRSRATLFDVDLLRDERHRRFIERELRAAILLDQLELHYQPIVDEAGTVQGVEALVRWRQETRGLIPPLEFIAIAEETTLIDMLGEWVFRRACRDFDALPGHSVAINVSAAQLRRNDILEMAARVLGETGRTASSFVIEITENVALHATPEVLARIEALREMGFRIALDDFGTGHCSFHYLRTIPVDFVKIDRSYIANLATDPVARVFVASVAEIGRLLGLVILAEGVETQEEFILARTAGCTRFQGYHFGRPVPLSDSRLAVG